MRVVVIGVNYGTDAMALRFVRSLSVIDKNANVTIVLVDNSEGTDSSQLFSNIWLENPDIVCVKPPCNLGYLGGANFGLNECLGIREEIPDWVIVSNVDIEFKDDAFFAHLRDVDHVEDVGVVTPSIWANRWWRDPNRGLISKPSKKRMKFFKLICQNFYVFNLYCLLAAVKHAVKYVVKYKLLTAVRVWLTPLLSNLELFYTAASEDGLKPIYAPHGACIVFSKSYFLRGGSLDYPVFLFGEEVYVAETAKSLGLRVVYNPRLKVWHDDHVSTGLVRSRKVASYMHEAAIFIADRYFQ